MKVLFDINHVQIMNGDVIRRIGQYKDVIAHYQTAGNPGRVELDATRDQLPRRDAGHLCHRLPRLHRPRIHPHLAR